MGIASREEVRIALIEELMFVCQSRRGSAAMVALFESGAADLPSIASERARELGRRLVEARHR